MNLKEHWGYKMLKKSVRENTKHFSLEAKRQLRGFLLSLITMVQGNLNLAFIGVLCLQECLTVFV